MTASRIPRYEQVKHELRAAIARREYVPGRPFITQREVCERFGVSTTTAVRALNDLVTEGILVRRQGSGTFVAEIEAGADRGPAGPSGSVACVIHGQGPIKAGVISGVESVCAELGLQLVLFDSKDSADIQERALTRALASGVGGVVLYAVQGTSDGPALAALRDHGIPLVTIDRYIADVATDTATADHFAVGYQLTQALIEAGHRRMALLWDETDCTSVRDRLSGHLQALRDNGIPERPDLTVLTSHQRLDQSARIARLQAILGQPEPPTVLICGDGYVVVTAAADLAQVGICVPDQVELAGLDDAGPHNILPLTAATAVVPAEAMGREAMKLLAARLSPGAPAQAPRRIVLPITVQTRDAGQAYLQVVHGR